MPVLRNVTVTLEIEQVLRREGVKEYSKLRPETKALTGELMASSPLSPGMPGFAILEQWQVFQLVSAEEIGVSLTSSGIMVPRKSVSMVIGIGPQMTT